MSPAERVGQTAQTEHRTMDVLREVAPAWRPVLSLVLLWSKVEKEDWPWRWDGDKSSGLQSVLRTERGQS